MSVPAGSYTLSETGPSGYSEALACTGAADTNPSNGLVLVAGETVTCTFTNTYIVPTDPVLTLVKSLNNTGGGTAALGDFTLSYSDGSGNSGSGASGTAAVTSVSVPAGSYTLSETGPSGYSEALACTGAADTNPSNGLVLVAGETVTCTFTNIFQPAGSLTLVKTATLNDDDGTPGLSAGDTISYAFTVTNTGNVTLTGIAVTDPDATITGSPILTLAPGATDTSVTGVHTLTQPEIDSGAFANSADATGQDPDGTDVSDTSGTDATNDTPTEVTLSPAGSLTLVKTATLNDDDGTPGLSAGDTISYAFTVTNTGNVTLTGIAVTDPDATITGSPILTLAPGATDTSVTGVHTLTQPEIDSGAFANSADATGQDPDGTDVSDTSGTDATNDTPTEVTLSPAGSLTLVKTATLNDDDGTPGLSAGDTISYAFTVTNTGNVTLTGIAVTDPDATITGSPILTLAPGATDTSVTGVHTLTQPEIDSGAFANSADATGQDPDGTDVSDTSGTDATNDTPTEVTLSPAGSLTLVKTATLNDDDGTPGLSAGDTISYAFTVTNTGNVTLTGIAVTDPDATITGSPILTLAPGATDTSVTGVHVLTQPEIDSGAFANSADATGQDPDGTDVSDTSGTDATNDTPTEVTLPPAPALTISKSSPPVLPADFVVGYVVNYSYEVVNVGNVTLLDPVTVSDNRISGVVCDPLPPSGFVPGASLFCTGTDTVTSNDVALGSLTNNASATSGTTVSPTTSYTIPTGSAPALSIAKSLPAGGGFDVAGQTLTYNYIITNSGNSAFVSDVTVTDDKSGGVVCFDSVGGTASFNPGDL